MYVFNMLCGACVLYLLSLSFSYAASDSLKGLWQTADYETVQPRFQVRITEYQGEYQATIVKTVQTKDESAICQQCVDFRKDQPLTGLLLASGITKDVENQIYDGGTIVDPDTGEVYRCQMELSEIGDELEVRSYTLAPLFGHSKIWKRIK